MENERIAEAEAAAQSAADALVGKSAGELEAAQLEAYEAFQLRAAELEGAEATPEQEQELEELRRAYEATKTAKANIVRDGLQKELWDARAADGLDGLRAIVAEASATQFALAKISQEFPKDEGIANDLGAAET
jgi:hypothetical protein